MTPILTMSLSAKSGFVIALQNDWQRSLFHFNLFVFHLIDCLTMGLPVPIDLYFNKPDNKEPLISQTIRAVHY